MTCCVALKNRGHVIVGADRCQTWDSGDYVVSRHSKVWNSGAFIVATSGSPRVGQIIRTTVKMPSKPPKDLLGYMVEAFCFTARKALELHEWKSAAEEKPLEGALIVAAKDRVFEVQSDFSVIESDAEYTTVGSGGSFALGSLATRGRGVPARKRVRDALRAAEQHMNSVRGPFDLEETR